MFNGQPILKNYREIEKNAACGCVRIMSVSVGNDKPVWAWAWACVLRTSKS